MINILSLACCNFIQAPSLSLYPPSRTVTMTTLSSSSLISAWFCDAVSRFARIDTHLLHLVKNM
ncbi:unnamed protein product [Amoebophrya sp. A25]|nr:unnamed protein product [Amoebophrya sp. A25]|eukprot:GSA25T00008169001.1